MKPGEIGTDYPKTQRFEVHAGKAFKPTFTVNIMLIEVAYTSTRRITKCVGSLWLRAILLA